MDAQSKIAEAKAAVQRDDPALARTILKRVIQQHPQNVGAWWLLADVIDDPDHAIQCLERVLMLEPDHHAARQRLTELMVPSTEISTPSQADYDPASGAQQQTPGRLEADLIEAYPSVPTAKPQDEIPEPGQPVSPTPPPQKSHPQKQRGSVKTQKVTKQPRTKSSRWLEISLLVVVLMCLCVVSLLAIGYYAPSSSLQFGPTPTVEDVRVVVYENLDAANREDIERYMDTIHPRAAGRGISRSTMQDLFDKYDLYYSISDLQVLEVTDKEARVSFALTTRKINGPSFQDNWISLVMTLRLDGGGWKIYDQEVKNIIYLD
jgi:hypothetical protein